MIGAYIESRNPARGNIIRFQAMQQSRRFLAHGAWNLHNIKLHIQYHKDRAHCQHNSHYAG